MISFSTYLFITWTVMMQRIRDVQVVKITTKNAILKRRLADRNLFCIRSNMA
jgi:hypothetical protein